MRKKGSEMQDLKGPGNEVAGRGIESLSQAGYGNQLSRESSRFVPWKTQEATYDSRGLSNCWSRSSCVLDASLIPK